MLLISALALASLRAAPAPTTINLGRTFQKGEKLAYQVLSHITPETRMQGLETFIPTDIDINYNFTTSVTQLRPEGIAVVHYLRPSMTQIEDEVNSDQAKTTVDKVNLDYQLTVSPINEILEQKQLSKPGGSAKEGDSWMARPAPRQGVAQFFGAFIGDVHRLALFIGGVQDGMDFAPRLPLNDVKVGDVWKRTVGYQPQKLKDKSGKIAVQRLDYTYTYLGPMDTDGKKVLRVEAKLDFSTDLADFLKQLLADRANETNIAKVPLHFKATIDYDLDPKTHETLHAQAISEGGYGVYLVGSESDAAEEERFKGRTTLDLVGKKIVP